LRNSLNVALPDTANFIDPAGSRLTEAAGFSGKNCGISGKVTVANGSQRRPN